MSLVYLSSSFWPGNAWGYPQSCLNPKPWCLPLNTMRGGAWGLFSLTFSSLLPEGGENPKPQRCYIQSVLPLFLQIFALPKKKLLVQDSLWLQSPAIFQIPGNHDLLRSEVNSGFQTSSKLHFFTPGTVSPHKNMNNKCLLNEWNTQPFFFIMMARELILKPRTIIPSHFSLSFRASPAKDLVLSKRGRGRKGFRGSLDLGSAQKDPKIKFYFTLGKTRISGVWGYSHRGPCFNMQIPRAVTEPGEP